MLLVVLILVLILIVGVYLYSRRNKMPIYKDNKEISEIYHGSKQISEVYHGSKLVYESYKEPWYKSDESGYRYGVMNKSTSIVDKGVYNNGTVFCPSGYYSIIDGKVWYNYMSSEITSLNGANFVDVVNSPYIGFKNGKLYTIYSTGGTERLSGGWIKSFGSAGESNAKYAIKNNEIYKIVFNAGNNPTVNTVTKVMDFTSSVILPKFLQSNYVIIDNDLYEGANSYSLTLIDSGGWTAVGSSCGIKNGAVYLLRDNLGNLVLLNNSKNWIDISFSYSIGEYFIADDGSLGKLTSSGYTSTVQLEPFKKSHKLKGRWESFSDIGNLVIRNGALYVLAYNDIILIDDSRYYTKCSGSNGFGVAVSSGNRIIDNS